MASWREEYTKKMGTIAAQQDTTDREMALLRADNQDLRRRLEGVEAEN